MLESLVACVISEHFKCASQQHTGIYHENRASKGGGVAGKEKRRRVDVLMLCCLREEEAGLGADRGAET